jgi:hypothetical protein
VTHRFVEFEYKDGKEAIAFLSHPKLVFMLHLPVKKLGSQNRHSVRDPSACMKNRSAVGVRIKSDGSKSFREGSPIKDRDKQHPATFAKFSFSVERSFDQKRQ